MKKSYFINHAKSLDMPITFLYSICYFNTVQFPRLAPTIIKIFPTFDHILYWRTTTYPPLLGTLESTIRQEHGRKFMHISDYHCQQKLSNCFLSKLNFSLLQPFTTKFFLQPVIFLHRDNGAITHSHFSILIY